MCMPYCSRQFVYTDIVSNVFPTLLAEPLLPLHSPVGAKKLCIVVHRTVFSQKVIPYLQFILCSYAKIFHDYTKTNYISAENICSSLEK